MNAGSRHVAWQANLEGEVAALAANAEQLILNVTVRTEDTADRQYSADTRVDRLAVRRARHTWYGTPMVDS